MLNFYNKYKEKGYIIFSAHIKQSFNENKNLWNKEANMSPQWQKFTLNDNTFKPSSNSMALLTGKVNNIIVLDVDDINKFNQFLKENNQNEPDTVSAISGSGGKHYYFKYIDNINIKNNSNSFGKGSKIDIRSNGGCIYIPPSSYYNKNLNKQVEYTWIKSIFDYELSDFPQWMIKLLENKDNNSVISKSNKTKISKITNIKKNGNNDNNDNDNNSIIEEYDKKYGNINYTYEEIEKITDLLSLDRIKNYSTWFEIGVCLYNINPAYITIWKKISKKDKIGYKKGVCEEKWKSIDKSNKENKLTIGSLIHWVKNDNSEKFSKLKQNIKVNKLILAKYPNDNLELGETIKVNKQCQYTKINSNNCLIKGGPHHDYPNSMYVDITHNNLSIRCRHTECFGKTHPCEHMIQLNKYEVGQVYYGDITIVNNYGNIDDEYVDFQQIDIYENEDLNLLVYEGLNGKTESLANIIYYYNKDKYIFAEDNIWYAYNNHKWHKEGKISSSLIMIISETINKLYSDLLGYYKDKYKKNKNDDLLLKIKKIDNVIKSSKDINIKNNILLELSHIYSVKNNINKDFLKKLDSNNNLVGFNNGIYDLESFKCRDGKPEDYVSMSVGYDYTDKYSDNFKELIQFIQDIMPEEKEREYLLTYLSHGLHGNTLELLTILTAQGRNGKSKLIELINITFGQYFEAISSQLFTRPRPDADKPDPGLLNIIKKRIIIASEPEKNNKLNTGFLKFITGRDTTTLRNCHSNEMIKFSPKFITFLVCNDIPECDDIDNAFSRRLRCIHFPTEFVENPINEKQKKINANINKRFEYWKKDFILLLISYYKKYKETNKLEATEKILKWTNKYKEETDIYLSYLNERTIESDKNIHCIDLYFDFKNWFSERNPGVKKPTNKEFINGIKKYKKIIKVNINYKSQLGIKNISMISMINEDF